MMNTFDIQKRSLGVNFDANQQADVRVWAPLAKRVTISLNGTGVAIPLTKNDLGYWSAKTDQLKPGDHYKFILDNEVESADPASLAQPQGMYGRSQAIDTNAFYWEDSSWINPPVNEYRVYELDIYTFTPEGTLKAIVNKLGTLKKEGYNAILIKPVMPFTGLSNRYWAGTFLYTVQASYGGPRCLQHLVNACHYEGIAVIVDLPYNHARPQEPLTSGFGSYPHPQKRTANSVERKQEAYQQYYIENALMWFRDFHIDGIHLEPAHNLPNSACLLQAIRTYASQLTAITGRQYYLLAEQASDISSFIEQLCEDQKRMTANSSATSIIDKVGGNRGRDYTQSKQWTKTCHSDYIYDLRFAAILQEFFPSSNRRYLS